MEAKEIKTEAIVNYENAPVIIESFSVQTPSARGAATLYKFRSRNLLNRQKVDFVLKGGERLDAADFERRAVKLMYADGTHVHLLDETDYNQYSLELDTVKDEMQFFTEQLEGALGLIYNDRCVGVQLPTAVELTVIECDPSVKGNSATSRTKPVRLETGLVVQAPEYLSQGEKVRVDTRTGQFISRA